MTLPDNCHPDSTPRYYGGGTRRWNYFKDVLKKQFGEVVYKVGIDAGFDCPNRDGTKGWGGCAYCSQQGSHSPHLALQTSITGQLEKGKSFIRRRYGAQKYIVYLQAFTNTYGTLETLRERYEAALQDKEGLVGMSIASRPDCIDEQNADLLAEYASKMPYFTVELGLQSAFQNRLAWVNRQETLEDYHRAMEILRARGVKVISHVIFGFPGESFNEMVHTALLADRLGSTGIKLQMLHVIKGTKLAVMHGREALPLLTLEEYGERVLHVVERLNPELEIHRITGETADASLVAPDWVRHKTKFFDWFDAQLVARNTWQGRLFQG